MSTWKPQQTFLEGKCVFAYGVATALHTIMQDSSDKVNRGSIRQKVYNHKQTLLQYMI